MIQTYSGDKRSQIPMIPVSYIKKLDNRKHELEVEST